MRAMLLDAPGRPLRLAGPPRPEPGPGQVLLSVRACGVCRTDLHVADGDLPNAKLPLILGHEIVGMVAAVGAGVERVREGDRVGVPWLGWTCGTCGYCRAGREKLCERARFTGYQLDGGYAQYAVADARFPFSLPGAVVCAGIHMSEIPAFPYEILWGERVVRSVATLTRRDGEEFLKLAPAVPVRSTVEPFPLARANEALARLREGKLRGAAVLALAAP